MDDLLCAEFEIDVDRPSMARVYDYWLGGKDNFAADRELGDALVSVVPSVPIMARANRRFLCQATRFQAAELGIRQFLDIGSGIPTGHNVHEVAQDTDPAARVLYVDNDPIVGAHSRALLPSTAAGKAAFLLADARDPAIILAEPILAQTLDLHEPVGLLLVSVLMYFDDEIAHHIVRTLLDALPAGSCLTISHPTADFDPAAAETAIPMARKGGLTYWPRAEQEVAGFFDGLELVDPGVVPMLAWRPPAVAVGRPPVHSVFYRVGMARKR